MQNFSAVTWEWRSSFPWELISPSLRFHLMEKLPCRINAFRLSRETYQNLHGLESVDSYPGEICGFGVFRSLIPDCSAGKFPWFVFW